MNTEEYRRRAKQNYLEGLAIVVRRDAVSHEQKLAAAIAWLRSRGKYILDKDTPQPRWGTLKKENGK